MRRALIITTLSLLLGFSFNILAVAKPAIAVLDFELNDLTIHGDNQAEHTRTASIAPLLRQALQEQHQLPVAEIPSEVQAAASPGFGYLYSRHELAAKLGAAHQAQWIVVGRLHKPSYLFAYLKVQLIAVDTGQRIADLSVEIKGSGAALTQRGVNTLATQIAEAIASTQATSQ